MQDQKMKIKNIKVYQCNLSLSDIKNDYYSINFDGQKGLFTREEWKEEEEIISLFDGESQEKILNMLENYEVII